MQNTNEQTPNFLLKWMKEKGEFFLWICISLNFILGLIYRLFFWCQIPVTKGEPYGIGDILELFIGVQLLFLLGINLIVLAIKLFKKDWKGNRAMAISLAVTFILPVVYFWINSLIRPICY